MANKDFKVKNGLDIQTPLPVSMGGTGQTSTSNTLNSLLPVQTGNSGKFLTSDGTNTSWSTVAKGLNSGTLAQRPGSASNGDLYFNTDDMEIEVYQNGNWLIANVTPGIPTSVTATNQGSGRAFNDGQASVAFTAATTGGPVKTFTVTPSPSTSPSTFTGSSSPITVTGLASSTQYTYTVTGGSNVGTSAASAASAGVTATTVPQAPTTGTPTNTAGAAFGSATNSVSVPITANGTGGSAVTSYTTISSPGSFTATGSSSPLTVSGLSVGTTYTFTSTLANANGTSLSSSASPSITPSTVPQAPTIGTATAGAAQATVTFTAGATGGSAITSYTATSSPGGFTGTAASSPITVTGLTNGTAYTFTVTATNANGTSVASSASNSVAPVAPTNLILLGSSTGGTSTITFSGLPSNYTKFIVMGQLQTTSGSMTPFMRMNGFSTGYDLTSSHIYGNLGTQANYTVYNGSQINFSSNAITQTNTNAVSLYMEFNQSSANLHRTGYSISMYYRGVTAVESQYSAFSLRQTGALTSVSIHDPSGTFSGVTNIAIYGASK